MVFFMNGLTVFLMSCPYLEAFILPSNSTMGPIPCQEKQPQIMTELLPICTVGLVHLMECVSSTMCRTQTLPLLWTLTNLLSSENNTFSNPQQKNVHVVWPCVWSGTFLGHQVHQAHGANGQQLCHDLGLFLLARDGAHGRIGG